MMRHRSARAAWLREESPAEVGGSRQYARRRKGRKRILSDPRPALIPTGTDNAPWRRRDIRSPRGTISPWVTFQADNHEPIGTPRPGQERSVRDGGAAVMAL